MENHTPVIPLVVLLRRATVGDEAALQALLTEVAVPVRRFLKRRVWDHLFDEALLDDLTQETLLRIYAGLQGCTAEGDGQIIGWCLAIARSALLDHLRVYQRQLELLDVAADVEGAAGHTSAREWEREGGESPALSVLLRVLQDVQAELPADTCTLLWLRVQHSASWSEVGVALGTTEAGAKRRYQRAQQTLRKAVLRRIPDLPPAERNAILAWLHARGLQEMAA